MTTPTQPRRRPHRRSGMFFLLALIALVGVGCVGTISQSKDGKTRVDWCPPSLAMSGHGTLYHPQCATKPTKKKKAQGHKDQIARAGTADALRTLMP